MEIVDAINHVDQTFKIRTRDQETSTKKTRLWSATVEPRLSPSVEKSNENISSNSNSSRTRRRGPKQKGENKERKRNGRQVSACVSAVYDLRALPLHPPTILPLSLPRQTRIPARVPGGVGSRDCFVASFLDYLFLSSPTGRVIASGEPPFPPMALSLSLLFSFILGLYSIQRAIFFLFLIFSFIFSFFFFLQYVGYILFSFTWFPSGLVSCLCGSDCHFCQKVEKEGESRVPVVSLSLSHPQSGRWNARPVEC